MTSAPRVSPSVGARAIARTLLPPRCWATSARTERFSSPRVKSIVMAWRISGSPSGGNSTSTTGPATFTIRPTLLASLISVSILGFENPSPAGLGQRLGTAHDLGDRCGDLRLTGTVRLDGQDPDQVLGVVRRRLHRPPPGAVFRGR